MSGYILTATFKGICAHGGQASVMPGAMSPRVRVGGAPVVTITEPLPVRDCQNPPPPAGVGPCIVARPVAGSVRVLAGGVPLAVSGQPFLCVPTGEPLEVVPGQWRVRAT